VRQACRPVERAKRAGFQAASTLPLVIENRTIALGKRET
jgi:hypothetical protein